MKCLAVNTANTVLSVAVVDGDAVRYRFATPETRDQGNLILHHARAGLEAAGIDYAALDLLAVVTGPGSFTGIRIGLAALRGIALAAGKPLFGISSFDLFAPAEMTDNDIVAVESWREELYLQRGGHAPVNLKPEDFVGTLGGAPEKMRLFGDAAAKLAPFLPQAAVAETPLPDAVRAAEIAISRMTRGETAPPRPEPFYLRQADVTISDKYRKLAD